MPATAPLSFEEVMAGGFTLGLGDPEAGARAGREARRYLSMRGRVVIADVGAFIMDPSHTAMLEGVLRFAPFGADIRADAGVVRLFAPTPDPNLKLMVYQLAFSWNRTQYFFDGAKHVRRRSVLHAWRDTTTLFARLHEGVDATGPVVGAGTLRLTVPAFLRQLTTFRAPPRALGRFFNFFAGEALDAYVRRRRRASVA